MSLDKSSLSSLAKLSDAVSRFLVKGILPGRVGDEIKSLFLDVRFGFTGEEDVDEVVGWGNFSTISFWNTGIFLLFSYHEEYEYSV